MDCTFELATPDDDESIRHLLVANPVPGPITLSYQREPDYFLGCGTMGHFYQVAVGRQPIDGTIIGLGCRAIRPLFVNGQVREVGYLGQLRIDQRFWGRWLLSRAFRYLRHLHEADQRVTGYITTIIEENQVAHGVLVKHALRHFPRYREVDRIHTLGLIVARAARLLVSIPCRSRGYEICQATSTDLSPIVAFLQEHGAKRQFFPVYTEADFQSSPLTAGFCNEDFILAKRRGQIVGVIGLWDQSSYKQTVVHAYSGKLRRMRPLYNLGARFVGAHPLPLPGEHLSYIYASFICVAQDDPAIFGALLWRAYCLSAERGYAYLMVGLTTRDPLLKVVQRYPHIPYYSRLYTVCWSDEAELSLHEQLDGRIPYVEIAAL